MGCILRSERGLFREGVDYFLGCGKDFVDGRNQLVIAVVLFGNYSTGPIVASLLAPINYFNDFAVLHAHAKRTAPGRRAEASFIALANVVTCDTPVFPLRPVQSKLAQLVGFIATPDCDDVRS